MSLILDALRRSESERAAAGSVPGIGAEHHQPATGSGHSAYAWLGMLALLVVATLAWWLYVRMPEPAAVPVATALDMPALAGPVARPSPAAPPAVPAPSKNVAAEPALAQPPAPMPVKAAPRNTPDTPPSASAQVAELYRKSDPPPVAASAPAPAKAAPPAAPAAAPPSTTPNIETIAELARRELAAEQARSARAESEVEMLGELAQSFKDQVPTLYYRQHSWSGLANQRFVMINGETRREGDQVAAGVTLLEILPESSVLEFQGTRFRLRALNSWVNL